MNLKMNLKQFHNVPSQEEVFGLQEGGYQMRFYRSKVDFNFYLNINENIFGPFNSMQEGFEFLAREFLLVNRAKDQLIYRIKEAIYEADSECLMQ